MKEVELKVTGMSCAVCASRVEKTLKNIDGVLEASVNLAAGLAKVKYDPSKVSERVLISSIEKEGYGAEPLELFPTELEEQGKDQEQQLLFRMIIGAVLGLGCFILSMEGLFPWVLKIPQELRKILIFALATPVQFWVGYPFLKGAVSALKHKSPDMNTLVSLGSLSAYWYSVFAMTFPQVLIRAGATPHLYFDSSCMIIVFVLFGKFLEERAKTKAASSMTKLLSLIPKTALVELPDGQRKEVPIGQIKQGDIVIVKPSQRIPVDGTILEGNTTVDESVITGEAIPVEKARQDQVIGGTTNLHGTFKMVAQKIGQDTLLSQIIKVVQEAQGSKANIQRLSDKVASYFVPFVIASAIASAAIWFFFGPEPKITNSLLSLVSVLVIPNYALPKRAKMNFHFISTSCSIDSACLTCTFWVKQFPFVFALFRSPSGLAILPNLLCCSGLEVPKYVFAPRASLSKGKLANCIIWGYSLPLRHGTCNPRCSHGGYWQGSRARHTDQKRHCY